MNEVITGKSSLWIQLAETAIQKCSYEKVFWNYAQNLQENTNAEMWFQ